MEQKKIIQIINDLIEESNNTKENFVSALNIIKEKINQDTDKYNDKLNNLKNEICNTKEEYDNEFNHIKALKIFNSVDDFFEFTTNLYNVEEWGIYPLTYLERANSLRYTSYWEELKKLFESKKLIDKSLGDEQLVSYFDTMKLMYFILSKIKNKNILEELKIIMEYRINTVEKERPDYLLIYRNEIIILEFGNASSLNKVKKYKSDKLIQLNEYENSLKNTLANKNINYNKIPVVYLPDTNEKFNNDLINDISSKIISILNNNNYSAFESIIKAK